MRTANAARHSNMRPHAVVLIGIFMVMAAVVAVPFYSVRSSSLGSVSSNIPAKATAIKSEVRARSSSRIEELLAEPASPFVEGVATYAADCTTPTTDFNLGDTVCAKASGVPVSLFPWRVNWVDPDGLIRQSLPASTDDSTTYIFTVPSTATSTVNDQPVDNRGTWRVDLVRPNGAVRQTARCVVHEPLNPQADVLVQKFQRDANDQVHSGDNIAFIIVVANGGPDPSSDVHLVDSIPAGASLVSFTQNSGPTCAPAGSNDCTMATMANGDRAEFTAIYNLGSNSAGTYQTSATAAGTTPDPNADNNTASTEFNIQTGSSNVSCDLTCPSSIVASADTTEGGQRGTHVTFDDAAQSGTCGSVTASPASGSFFPVGSTVVTVTSETGNGSCTFSVTVNDPNGNTTISCPGNKTADADANCAATVSLGNPTTTGDNVTSYATRSDGQPVYNCDANGNCTRLGSDAPFSAGITTITWFAYSHDVAGPYTTLGPNCPGENCKGDTFEEQHRTGTAACNQTVTVTDVTPPTITAADQTASADANCQAHVPDFSTIAVVSDNCACASSDTSQICDTRQNITITQSPAAGTLVGLGPHTITLSANDGSSNNGGAGNTTTIQVTFTVNDTTAPTFTFVPPTVVAYTGPGATSCDTVVSDATLGTATATDNCSAVTITRSPSGNTFSVGNTTVTWTATDAAGNHSSATQTVTVIDNTAPTITTNGQVPSMWPPDHTLHTFQVTDFVTSVFDNCGGVGVSDVVISQVTSDELDDATGGGDGNTVNDIQIAANCKSVQLRSERAGSGDGRVYIITFRLTDTHGNVTTATAKVTVAHDQGAGPETVIDSGPHYTVNGGCP